jgi:hypothetical protein
MAARQAYFGRIFVEDRRGNRIYLTWERWEHALDHPGMDDGVLEAVLNTVRLGDRQQDRYDQAKYKYVRAFSALPYPYTHVAVIVKFGWQGDPADANNFVLTAYLIEKW